MKNVIGNLLIIWVTFGRDGHFHNIKSSNPGAWKVFSSSKIFFTSLPQHLKFLIIEVFHFIWLDLSQLIAVG